jgi:hypothetical protein
VSTGRHHGFESLAEAFGPPWRPWSEVGVDEAEARGGDHVKAAKHAKKAKKLGRDYERHVRGY